MRPISHAEDPNFSDAEDPTCQPIAPVPVDSLSDRLFRAIIPGAAIRSGFAKRSAGRLHVLYVNDPLLVAAAAVALGDRTFASVALGELPPFVAKAIPAGTIKAAAINYVAETGQPDRTIVATAQRLRCDLIVMGTHGLSGADRLLIGSTTERLFRLTPVPLLAVPPPLAVERRT